MDFLLETSHNLLNSLPNSDEMSYETDDFSLHSIAYVDVSIDSIEITVKNVLLDGLIADVNYEFQPYFPGYGASHLAFLKTLKNADFNNVKPHRVKPEMYEVFEDSDRSYTALVLGDRVLPNLRDEAVTRAFDERMGSYEARHTRTLTSLSKAFDQLLLSGTYGLPLDIQSVMGSSYIDMPITGDTTSLEADRQRYCNVIDTTLATELTLEGLLLGALQREVYEMRRDMEYLRGNDKKRFLHAEETFDDTYNALTAVVSYVAHNRRVNESVVDSGIVQTVSPSYITSIKNQWSNAIQRVIHAYSKDMEDTYSA
mgnify:FL=1